MFVRFDGVDRDQYVSVPKIKQIYVLYLIVHLWTYLELWLRYFVNRLNSVLVYDHHLLPVSHCEPWVTCHYRLHFLCKLQHILYLWGAWPHYEHLPLKQKGHSPSLDCDSPLALLRTTVLNHVIVVGESDLVWHPDINTNDAINVITWPLVPFEVDDWVDKDLWDFWRDVPQDLICFGYSNIQSVYVPSSTKGADYLLVLGAYPGSGVTWRSNSGMIRIPLTKAHLTIFLV